MGDLSFGYVVIVTLSRCLAIRTFLFSPPLPFYSLHNDESVHSRSYAKYHIEIDVLLKREHVRFNLTPVRPLAHASMYIWQQIICWATTTTMVSCYIGQSKIDHYASKPLALSDFHCLT